MKNFCGEASGGEGLSDQWFTPKWILDACGLFDLDPCGDKRWETADMIYESRGLEQDWHGRVWLNPPYGRDIGLWTDKLAEHGNGLALVFARTDTQWFQRFAKHTDWILFLNKRVKFIKGDTLQTAGTPGAPSMLCAVGPQKVPNIEGQLFRYDDID